MPTLDLTLPNIAHLPLPRTAAQYPGVTLATPAGTPPLARVGWYPSTNGPATRIYVLFVGTAEAIEKHEPAIADVNARGRDVLVFEFTGAGDSGRFLADPLKVHAPRRGFDFWSDSIGEFLDSDMFAGIAAHARQNRSRLIAMPYSLGGLHFARAALKRPDHARHFSHIVYVNPALVFKSAGATALARHWNELKGRLAALAGMREQFVPGHGRDPSGRPVEKSPLGTDPGRHDWVNQFYRANPNLVLWGMTFGWFVESNNATRLFWHGLVARALTGRAHTDVPTLVISSGRDDIVIATYVRRFAQLIGADVLELPTSKHEPTQETNDIRNATIAAVAGWLDGLSRPSSCDDSLVRLRYNRPRPGRQLGRSTQATA